jgi:hypothetical protein
VENLLKMVFKVRDNNWIIEQGSLGAPMMDWTRDRKSLLRIR